MESEGVQYTANILASNPTLARRFAEIDQDPAYSGMPPQEAAVAKVKAADALKTEIAGEIADEFIARAEATAPGEEGTQFNFQDNLTNAAARVLARHDENTGRVDEESAQQEVRLDHGADASALRNEAQSRTTGERDFNVSAPAVNPGGKSDAEEKMAAHAGGAQVVRGVVEGLPILPNRSPILSRMKADQNLARAVREMKSSVTHPQPPKPVGID